MPGVLILEAMAQVGAGALLSEEQNRGKIVLFGGVKNARFRRKVPPGDVLDMTCTLMTRQVPMGVGQCEAKVGDDTACTAELIFVVEENRGGSLPQS